MDFVPFALFDDFLVPVLQLTRAVVLLVAGPVPWRSDGVETGSSAAVYIYCCFRILWLPNSWTNRVSVFFSVSPDSEGIGNPIEFVPLEASDTLAIIPKKV